MAREKRLGQVVLKRVRLSFPHLWEPSQSSEDGDLKYRAAFLMDPETKAGQACIKIIEDAIAEVKQEAWKDMAKKIKLKDDRLCFKNGSDCTSQETGEIYQGYEGMMVISSSNKRRPQVVDRDKTPLTEEDDKPYAGCYVNGVINIYAIKDQKKGGNGIFATLEAVQFADHGEAFGAAPVDIDDVFDDISDEEMEDEV